MIARSARAMTERRAVMTERRAVMTVRTDPVALPDAMSVPAELAKVALNAIAQSGSSA
jgi:hypothetical protein